MKHYNSKLAERMFAWRGEPTNMPPTKLGLDEAWLATWKAKIHYTPDAAKLSQKMCHPLFVYDRLMEGRDDFNLICDHAIPIATAYTVNKFECWRKNMGVLSRPIAMESFQRNKSNNLWQDISLANPRIAPPALVKGYLYSIFSDAFFELDKHYRNMIQFERKKILVQIPFRYDRANTMKGNGGNEFIARLEAWMYVGVPDYWEKQFDAGLFFSPTKLHKPKNELLSTYSFFGPPTGPIPQEEQPIQLKRLITKTVKDKDGKEWMEHVEVDCPIDQPIRPYYGVTPKREDQTSIIIQTESVKTKGEQSSKE